MRFMVAASVLPGGAVSEVGVGSAATVGSDAGLVAVGAGGFSDVDDGSVHASAVGVLAASGVFDGTECGEGLFCPDEPLQRWAMAVWLVRMLDGADTTPVVSGVFSDVDYEQSYAPFADRLSELGVTRGCAVGPLRYCPDRNVTRGQMAAFLVRAFSLGTGPGAGFTDVGAGHTFVDDIDALAASRVTAGCAASPLRFCPDKNVTRAQMATFLARAAGLVDLPAPVGAQPEEPALFDPFSAPTVSDIDLERLGVAVATLDPEAVCPETAAPPSLDDMAEVVRISGGCLSVEYIPLGGRTIAQVRQGLASDPDVHAVDLPVTDIHLLDFHYDEVGKEQWHLKAIQADKLWAGWEDDDGRRWPGSEGAGVVVAVIDAGVDGTHRDLDKNLITTGRACHRTPNRDHGTHVAGIIAAERNKRDVVGVAPEARILPIRRGERCSALTTAGLVAAAMEQGADVVNMSYGNYGNWHSATEETVIRAAMMRDIVLVAAAGNCGIDTPEELEANDCDGMHNLVMYPAAYAGVISVASTDSNDVRAASSTANPHVGIAAPGKKILSTVSAHTASDEPPCDEGTTCYVGDASGTSSAAPVIAGVVAHMKARFPEASVGEIRQALYVTAQNPDSGRTGHLTWEYGWGIVQPLDAIGDLESRFFSCDSLLADPQGLLAYDIDVDIYADGDGVDDDRVTDEWRRRDVWVADEDGDAWCRVAHNAEHPAWSPDGQQLAFAHRTYTTHIDPKTGRWAADWQADIWVTPTEGGPWRRVTDTAAQEYDLDWSRSGQLAYTANTGAGYEIWVVDVSGSGAPTDLTGAIPGSQFQPSWSPDGTRIVYASGQDGDNDIWVMNADGTGRRNLTTGTLTAGGRTLGDGKEEQPAWSPDGTRIVYVSDRNGGDNDIWVMNADGTGHRNLHDNNNPEWKPAWSPQGDRVVFVHNTGQPDADDDIWTMDAQTGQNWTLITKATADDVRFNAAAESNPVWSPPRDDRQVKISWGNDATSRADCPTGETCLNLRYEFIGTWDPAPYTLQCWTNNNRSWTGQWSGRETTGCYYWGEPAHVVIDGIRSNTIIWTAPPPPDDRQVTISWGSDATSRAACPTGEACLDLRYEFIGTWDPAPYTLQCWSGNNRSWTGQWSGRETTGCYYWGEPAHVVIDGIRSNTIIWTPRPGPVGTPSCGNGGGVEPCRYLVYEEAFDDNGDGYAERSEIWVSSADGPDQRKLVDGSDPIWSPDGSMIVYFARSGFPWAMWVMSVDGTGVPRKLHDNAWSYHIDEEWLWSPDSKHVAYRILRDDDNDHGAERSELWAGVADGSTPPRKLVHSVAQYSPRLWSPDSTHIAYTSNVDNDNDGSTESAELWVVAVDGSSPPRRLSGYGSFGAAWAPVGSRIAFPSWSVSDAGTRLHSEGLRVANADGTNEYRIADRGETPQWSPDGQRIAYGDFGRWWVTAADGSGTPRRFVDGSVFDFVWSPDGQRIAYHLSVDTDGDGTRDSWELRVTTADGNGEHIRFADKAQVSNIFVVGSPWEQNEPWSIDGAHLVYAVPTRDAVLYRGTPHEELWVTRSDGSGSACRLTTSGRLRGWSPNGQHIAYNVPIDDDGDNVADRNSWWVARADCTGTRKLTDGGWVEGWSPTGTHIAYSVPVDADNDGKDDRVEVWIVDIAGGGPPLLVTSNAPVYTSPTFSSPAWSPV